MTEGASRGIKLYITVVLTYIIHSHLHKGVSIISFCIHRRLVSKTRRRSGPALGSESSKPTLPLQGGCRVLERMDDSRSVTISTNHIQSLVLSLGVSNTRSSSLCLLYFLYHLQYMSHNPLPSRSL